MARTTGRILRCEVRVTDPSSSKCSTGRDSHKERTLVVNTKLLMEKLTFSHRELITNIIKHLW